MFRQYHDVQEKALFYKAETERLTEKLVSYEAMIAEMSGSVKSFHARNQFHAKQVKVIDEDEIICGANRPKEQKSPSKRRKKTTSIDVDPMR